MTGAEWQTCADPTWMLQFLRGRASERKRCLFAVACCRRVGRLVVDERSKRVIELAERYAEGEAVHQAMIQAALAALQGADQASPSIPETEAVLAITRMTTDITENVEFDVARHAARAAGAGEPALQADLLRDIFGNPTRPVTIDASWFTPGLVNLACTIYDLRAFDRMPMLADALKEAGCTSFDILAHCYQPGEHVRGCWVVDLILGKS